jgi:hypothetical protein
MSSLRPRRLVRRAPTLVGTAAAVALVASGCITNAGSFDVTVLPDSTFSLSDGTGEGTFVYLFGGPSCSDGTDDDHDGNADYPADTQCASAGDANERLSGAQTYAPTVMPIEIDAAGVITGEPTDLEHQQVENCVDLGSPNGVWCMGVTFVGTGTTQTTQIDEVNDVITVSMPINIELDAVVGFSGLGANCRIGPVNAVLTADDYDTVTGHATLVASDVAVPAVTGCDPYTAAINGYMQLPGSAVFSLNATILDGDGDPIAFDS